MERDVNREMERDVNMEVKREVEREMESEVGEGMCTLPPISFHGMDVWRRWVV